jgi:uncharacterized protein
MDPRFGSLRSAVVKLTNRCNLRCTYCYEDIVVRGQDMTPAVFQRMAHAILSSTSEPRVLFILHGGEPTILPEDWFEENLDAARTLAQLYGKQVEFSIQSNLISISDQKLRIFQKYDVGIGGSLDNPDFVGESFRPQARRALNTYLRAREMGSRVGILATINASNVNGMRLYCDWLLNSVQVHHFKANVAYPVGAGVAMLVPRAKAIFNAQRDVVEFMMETDGALVEENLAQEIVRFFESHHGGRDRAGTLCDDHRCGAGMKVVGVTPEGNLLPCGRFAWNESGAFLGSLAADADEREAAEFFEKVDRFQELNPENWRHCGQCEAKAVCGFGCQAFIVRSIAKRNIECEPTRLRFAYYQENIDRLQRLYERICEQQGRTPMSRFDQKLSRLRRLVPPAMYPAVERELRAALEHQPV